MSNYSKGYPASTLEEAIAQAQAARDSDAREYADQGKTYVIRMSNYGTAVYTEALSGGKSSKTSSETSSETSPHRNLYREALIRRLQAMGPREDLPDTYHWPAILRLDPKSCDCTSELSTVALSVLEQLVIDRDEEGEDSDDEELPPLIYDPRPTSEAEHFLARQVANLLNHGATFKRGDEVPQPNAADEIVIGGLWGVDASPPGHEVVWMPSPYTGYLAPTLPTQVEPGAEVSNEEDETETEEFTSSCEDDDCDCGVCDVCRLPLSECNANAANRDRAALRIAAMMHTSREHADVRYALSRLAAFNEFIKTPADQKLFSTEMDILGGALASITSAGRTMGWPGLSQATLILITAATTSSLYRKRLPLALRIIVDTCDGVRVGRARTREKK